MSKRYLFIFLTTASLAPAVILAVFWFSAFDRSWYRAKQADLGVGQSLGELRVSQETENVFSFLAGQDALNGEFYTSRERQHIIDIRNLIFKFKVITAIDLIILFSVLICSWRREGKVLFIKNIFWAGSAGSIIFIPSAALVYFFFDQVFIIFHRLLFANDFWLLDPATEKLVVIFPPELFAALGSKIIFASLLANLIIIIFSGIFLWRQKRSW